MKRFKNLFYTVAFPLVMFLIMEIICYSVKGRHVIGSFLDVKTLVRNTGITAFSAFALSFNLTCGRFDLSLGAQRLAGTIVGGIVATSLGLSGVWVLVISVAFGLLFGLITGLFFVTLRIPPMVLGIGVGLLLECIPYKVSQGKGLNLFGKPGITILSNTYFVIALVIGVAFLISVLMNTTRFGYEMRAIQGSQLIARNSGIDIFKHAVICYTLAGAVICIAGVIDTGFTTQMSSTLGLATVGAVSQHMFAMVLGGFIGKWSNESVGIIIASITVRIFSLGLINLEFSEPNTNLANSILFVIFLVYVANQDFFKNRSAVAARIAEAQAIKKAKAEALA